MCRKVRRNVVLELKSVEDGSAVFLLHLGDRKALPADFMHRYGTESFREKLCRLLKCVGEARSKYNITITVTDMGTPKNENRAQHNRAGVRLQ